MMIILESEIVIKPQGTTTVAPINGQCRVKAQSPLAED